MVGRGVDLVLRLLGGVVRREGILLRVGGCRGWVGDGGEGSSLVGFLFRVECVG